MKRAIARAVERQCSQLLAKMDAQLFQVKESLVPDTGKLASQTWSMVQSARRSAQTSRITV